MNKEHVFISRLQSASQRISSPRLAAFRTLLRKGPITIPQLVSLLEKQGIDPATTYRTMKLFRELEIIKDIVAGGRRLVELSDNYESHHHHFWCRNCGKLVDFDSPKLEQTIDQLAGELGIKISSHQLEMSGLCSDCLNKKESMVS